MLVVNDETLKNIENCVENGSTSRTSIFYKIISDDEELKKITKGYREGKSVEDITIEEKIPIDMVREGLAVIEELNKIIDQKIYKAHNKVYYEKRVIQENMPHSNNEELSKSIRAIQKTERLKKEAARTKLTKIVSEYMVIKRGKKGDAKSLKKFVKANINEFIEINNLLGFSTSKLLQLASMYNDLGDFQKANDALSRIDKGGMSEIDERNFNIIRNKALRLENANFIKTLYKKGLRDDKIFEECERVNSERRIASLDRDFINKVIKICAKREKLAESQINKKHELER